ncbi:MAG: Rieske 2Fe-2S domain-containing protein [Rubrivivax sp.]
MSAAGKVHAVLEATPGVDPWQLVQPDQIHRDLYLREDLFALEMERLWARAWLFVGHDSQVPQPGDVWATTLAGQPVLMLRGHDGAVRVLHNRCAHKGAPLRPEGASHAGQTLRCPYHACITVLTAPGSPRWTCWPTARRTVA